MTQVCLAEHYHQPDRPRRAADGSQLCHGCTQALDGRLERLPEVYDDVLERKVRGGSARISGTTEPPQVVTHEQIESRFLIRNTLVGWCRIVSEERDVSPPADTVEAMTAFLRRHSLWLTAQDFAGEYADEIGYVTREARRVAYPQRPERTYIGACPMHVLDADGLAVACGERVYALPDTPAVECSGCGTVQTVEEWQRVIVGRAGGIVDASTLLALLSARYFHVIARSTLRSWVHRGHVVPNAEQMYAWDAVVAYTDTVWHPVGRTA